MEWSISLSDMEDIVGIGMLWAHCGLSARRVRRMGLRWGWARARASLWVRLTVGSENVSAVQWWKEKRASKEQTSVKMSNQMLPKNANRR